jgi:hypothetical protein
MKKKYKPENKNIIDHLASMAAMAMNSLKATFGLLSLAFFHISKYFAWKMRVYKTLNLLAFKIQISWFPLQKTGVFIPKGAIICLFRRLTENYCLQPAHNSVKYI